MKRKRYGRNIIAHWFWSTLRSPWNLIEVIESTLLVAALLLLFYGFAGFIPDARSLPQFSVLLLLVTILYLIRLLADRSRHVHFYPALLVPLPFLAYAALHYLWLAPQPWRFGADIATWIQAYALFVMGLSISVKSRGRMRYLIITYIVVFTVLTAAFLQFYLLPEWMPYPDRVRAPELNYGPAGFFINPANLAALLTLIFPLSILITWIRCFAGPVRILTGFIALASGVGLFLSGHLWGLICMLLILLMLPLFMTTEWRTRRRIYGWSCLIILLLMPFAWFGTDALHQRMLMIWNWQPDMVAVTSRAVALQGFFMAPLTGHGIGNFNYLWFLLADDYALSYLRWPISGHAGVLSAAGVIGWLLLVGPLGWLWVRSLRIWKPITMYRPDPDIEKRLKGLSSRRRSALRRKLNKGRAPSAKVILAGMLTGWLFFMLYLLHDNAIRMAGVVMIAAMLAAVWVVFACNPVSLGKRQRGRIAIAAGPLALSLAAIAFGYPKFQANGLYLDASERLQAALRDPYRIFQDPAVIYEVEAQLNMVLKLQPNHADALSDAGEATLARAYMDLFDDMAIGSAALPYLTAAVEQDPLNWRSRFLLGRALALTGAADEQILAELDAAVFLAPQRAEPIALAAAIRLTSPDPDSPTEVANLQQALQLAPDYAPLRTLINRIEMSGGNVSNTLLTPRLLASQFDLRPSFNDYTAGSGRLHPDFIGGTLPLGME